MDPTHTSQFESRTKCIVHHAMPASGPPGTQLTMDLEVFDLYPAYTLLFIGSHSMEVTATLHPLYKNRCIVNAVVPPRPMDVAIGETVNVVLRHSDGHRYLISEFLYTRKADPDSPHPSATPCILSSRRSSAPSPSPIPSFPQAASVPLLRTISSNFSSNTSKRRLKPRTAHAITVTQSTRIIKKLSNPSTEKFQRREWRKGYSGDSDALFPSPAFDLTSLPFDMSANWTSKELSTGRRLVRFKWDVDGTSIRAVCKPIHQEDYNPQDLVISCIRRQDECLETEYLVTSCDLLYLIQTLLGVLFDNDEENRVRRNLQSVEYATFHSGKESARCDKPYMKEGTRPKSSRRAENKDKENIPICIRKDCNEAGRGKILEAEFFSRVMMYPDPKPRHIQKSFKVYRWEHLSMAVAMVFKKYFYAHVESPAPAEEPKEPKSDEDENFSASSVDETEVLALPENVRSPPASTDEREVPVQQGNKELPLVPNEELSSATKFQNTTSSMKYYPTSPQVGTGETDDYPQSKRSAPEELSKHSVLRPFTSADGHPASTNSSSFFFSAGEYSQSFTVSECMNVYECHPTSPPRGPSPTFSSWGCETNHVLLYSRELSEFEVGSIPPSTSPNELYPRYLM